VYLIVIAALLVLSVSFGGLWWYRGETIELQKQIISEQSEVIHSFKLDKKAQDKADKQLQAEKESIAKERNKYKKDLADALKDNECTDVPIPDDAKRLLDKLYNSQGS
jgi:uncharacterized membrane protein YfbV (UPF0208 family)